MRCSQELDGQISLKSKVPRFFSEFSSISTHRKFLEFYFKFQLEYGQVSIRRFVPHLKLFPAIFYLDFLELSRSTFCSKQIELV
jgi:hypothetical protein